MRILKKFCKLGDLRFNLGLDRNIICDIFESCPKIMETMDKMASEIDSEEKSEEKEDSSIFGLAKANKLRSFMNYRDGVEEAVEIALPLMLKKADENPEMAKEILDIAYKNSLDLFFDQIWSFIMSGFITVEEEKPKITFTME